MSYLQQPYRKTDKKPKDKRADTVGKTENFFSRNVKTITFCLTLAAFLAVFIPIGVIGIGKLDELFDPARHLPEMTLEDVVALSEREETLYLDDLTCYRGEKGEWTIGTVYTVYIGEEYLLRGVASHVDSRLESCVLYNQQTQEEVDVLEDDVRAFLAGQP